MSVSSRNLHGGWVDSKQRLWGVAILLFMRGGPLPPNGRRTVPLAWWSRSAPPTVSRAEGGREMAEEGGKKLADVVRDLKPAP